MLGDKKGRERKTTTKNRATLENKEWSVVLVANLNRKIREACWPGRPGGSNSKESACNVGDMSSIPGSGRSPGEGNGNPLQFSCLENSMDGGAW